MNVDEAKSLPLRVTLWNEFIHERRDIAARELYPAGMHVVWAESIRRHLGDVVSIRYGSLEEPDHGLSEAVLAETDVLAIWGHDAHDQFEDQIAERVVNRVLDGMGLLALHAAHYSKIFRRLMGTSCALRWRQGEDREIVWSVNPGHPICRGVPNPIVIPRQEMYGEHFDIPQPDELVFVSAFSGGEVFRSGCCFVRGRGRIFYFSPGDQEYPVYHQEEIGRVIANAIEWCAASTPRVGAAPEPYVERGWFEK